MVKISIILPCYNAGEYLHRSIPNCLHQTLKDIEIICVNDGSTDNTAEILQEYANKDNRIKIITQENQGTLVARKRGIEHASGEYCMFLDQDDFYELCACAELYSIIKEQDVEILEFNANVIEKNNTSFSCSSFPYKHQKLYALDALEKIFENQRHFRPWIWVKIFSTSLCKRVPPYIPEKYMTLHEDVLMFMMCFLFAETYYNIDNAYYTHYKDIGFCKGYSFSQFQKALSSAKILFSTLNDFIQNQKPDPYIEKILKKLIYWIELDCFQRFTTLCPPEQYKEGFLLILNTVSTGVLTEKYMQQYQLMQKQSKLIQQQESELRFYTSSPSNLNLTQALHSFHSHFPFLFKIQCNMLCRTHQIAQSLKQNGFRETCKKIIRYILKK